MQIHSVKLINYKSIGNYPESEIIIEPNVTAIIGKNESGKQTFSRAYRKFHLRRLMSKRSRSTKPTELALVKHLSNTR